MFPRLLRTTCRSSFFLARFTGDFPLPLTLCISRDRTRMQIEGVLCVHWREALEELGLCRGRELFAKGAARSDVGLRLRPTRAAAEPRKSLAPAPA